MIYHVDAYKNPKNGRGFSVCDAFGNLLSTSVLTPGSSNEAEVIAIANVALDCSNKSYIYSDSQVAIGWIRKGKSMKRPDLNPFLRRIQAVVRDKGIVIRWLPREQNQAGIFNDNCG